MNKKNIAQSFGKAASSYDKDAPVQKWTAHLLRDYISNLDLHAQSNCLEIGCGTGFLSEEMVKSYPNFNWTITDLSNDMLETCQSRLGSGPTYHLMDGENPDLTGPYDLIVSSLAVQWFHDLETGLAKLVNLLKPGGQLIITTLGKDTFSQWRDHLQSLNLPIGLHLYPSQSDVKKYVFPKRLIDVQSKHYLQDYDSGLDFLRSLKSIGAQEPNSKYNSITSGELRKALRTLESDGKNCKMTYEILLTHIYEKTF